MGSKGARYVELPIYVVNIGLLYALLLTSGLVLAWLTIYRHEESITELRQMLRDKVQDKRPSQAVDTDVYTNGGQDMLVQEDDNKETENDGPRVRRGKNKKGENKKVSIRNECNMKCVGEKGERGRKGKRGRQGKLGPPGPHGPPGPQGPPGYRGDRGERGYHGARGDTGDPGEKGEHGDMGRTGEKGDKGNGGSPGVKGSKGDRGPVGQTLMYSQSAHIVGTGNTIPSNPAPGDVYLVTSWKRQHVSGNMTYDDKGHLIVKVDGVYFVYGQMFYLDRNNTYTGFNVYVDNKRILKAIYSIVDFHKPYHTQFISGVFKITKGQRIWVGTTIKRKYFYNESSSFFGAFMIHP